MTVSREQQEAIDKMRAAQQKRNEVMEKTGRNARGVNSTDKPQKKEAPMDHKVKSPSVEQLEEQVRALRRKNAEISNQSRQNEEAKKYQAEQEALNSIVRNNDDYHFAKEYNITGPKGKTKKIVVKMHAPSVSEQAEIQQEYVDLTRGRGDGFVAMARELFLAVSYYRVVGDNVPVWFTQTDDTYRTDILFEVWSDYQEWLDQFLDSRFQ